MRVSLSLRQQRCFRERCSIPRWFARDFGTPEGPVSIGIEAELYVATSPDLEGVTGEYFDRARPGRANPQAYDAEARRRLWDLTEQLTGGSS